MKEELRDKDFTVLQAIQDGATNTSEINEATTLKLRQINYSINEKSLEKLGLIEVNRRKGREQGTWKPKELSLTDQGIKILAEVDQDLDEYQDMNRQELIQRIHELEERQNRLENMFKDFREKVMETI